MDFAAQLWTRADGGGGGAAGGQQVVDEQDARAGVERVGVHGHGGAAVFQRVFLLDGGEGQFAFLRTGTKPACSLRAAAAAKMKPRASMPTTASMLPGEKCSVSRSMAPANRRASASTGVMSLN